MKLNRSSLLVVTLLGLGSAVAAITNSGEQFSNPVQWFRQLLGSDPAIQQTMLENKAGWQRTRILSGIAEYDALDEEERERRLRTMELRMHLIPLLQLPRDQRLTAVADLPEDWKKTIENRLRYWDMYPPPMKDEILGFDETLINLDQLVDSTENQRNVIWGYASGDRREQLEQQLASWRSLTEVRRSQIRLRFEQFFHLPERDRRKALEKLSNQQRVQLGVILRRLSLEVPEKRETVINAFVDFISMSTDEQRQFALNADRWSKLSNEDQEKWRNISATMPPMPPVPHLGPLTMPPLPPGVVREAASLRSE